MSDNLYLVQKALSEGTHDPDIRRVLVVDGQRMVVASDQVSLIGETLPASLLEEAERSGREFVSIGLDEQGQERMIVFEPVYESEEAGSVSSSAAGGKLNQPPRPIVGWLLVELSLEGSRVEAYRTLGRQLLATAVLLLIALTVVRGTVRRLSGSLRAAEEKFRMIVEGEPECVTTVSLDGILLSINPTGLIMVEARSAEEVIGRPIADFVHSEDRVEFQKTHLMACEGKSEILQFRFLGLRGAVRWMEAHSAPLRDPQRDIVAVLSVNRDLTQQKLVEKALHESEAKLRQSQKMEAVGRMAGGVAHDFNNVLTVITGYSSLLLQYLPGEDEQRRNMMEQIEKAARRATMLTRQLLAFSRQQVLQPQELDLKAVLGQMADMLQRLIGESITLRIRPGSAPSIVKADQGQIEQVIMNLTVNARDAMPRGGELLIETDTVMFDQQAKAAGIMVPPGRYVVLSVSDTGCGMDAETQLRIFEPFFTTKEQGKGTGLGLSTVYGIVKQSDGDIMVSSQPGQGTTFKVYLPQVELSEKTRGTSQEVGRPTTGSETILVVEDEHAVREFIRNTLQRFGYRVLDAPNAAAALRIAEQYEDTIHLLLTDVIMRNMNGRELAEVLTSKRAAMRVIYMSGYTDDIVVHQGVREAEVAFLQKPFVPETLLRKVRDVLDSPQAQGRS
jgi:PAS domain S-box-containing protein